jgi:hypothetical protein
MISHVKEFLIRPSTQRILQQQWELSNPLGVRGKYVIFIGIGCMSNCVSTRNGGY